MGVLTSKDFGLGGNTRPDGLIRENSREGRPLPDRKELAAKGLEVAQKLVLPIAPKGKCNAAFRKRDGSEVQVELVDGEYLFPSGLGERERDELVKDLLFAGFVDQSTVRKARPRVLAKRYAHPDNTADRPVQGTIKIDTKRGKKRYKGELELDEFGTVTTDEPAFQTWLEKKGFAEVTVPSGTEDEDPTGDPGTGEPDGTGADQDDEETGGDGGADGADDGSEEE